MLPFVAMRQIGQKADKPDIGCGALVVNIDTRRSLRATFYSQFRQ